MDHAGRGLCRRALGYLVQWWCNARDYRSTSAAVRCTRRRRSSRSRSSRPCSRRRWRGSVAMLVLSGCLASTTRSSRSTASSARRSTASGSGSTTSDPRFDERVGEVLEASARCGAGASAARAGGSEAVTPLRVRLVALRRPPSGPGRVPHGADARDARSAPRANARPTQGVSPTRTARSCRAGCDAEAAGRDAARRPIAHDLALIDRRRRTARYADRIPIPVDRALLEKGRARFETFCAACHGILGDGNSVVAAKMALRKPPNLLDAAREHHAGRRVFQTIVDGYGLMPSYGVQLAVHDAWAVVAYLRRSAARAARTRERTSRRRARARSRRRRREPPAGSSSSPPLCAALAGLASLVVGLRVDPRRAWFAYLDAWIFGHDVASARCSS